MQQEVKEQQVTEIGVPAFANCRITLTTGIALLVEDTVVNVEKQMQEVTKDKITVTLATCLKECKKEVLKEKIKNIQFAHHG